MKILAAITLAAAVVGLPTAYDAMVMHAASQIGSAMQRITAHNDACDAVALDLANNASDAQMLADQRLCDARP